MEKSLLILLLSISSICNAQTGILGTEVFPTLNQRLGNGTLYFAGSLSLDSIGVLEPEIIRRTTDDTIRILYTGMRANGTSAVFLATTDSIGGTLTKWGVVIGQGVATIIKANCTGAVYYRDTLWAWCANGYGDEVYLYSSVDGGHNFFAEGVVFTRGGTVPGTLGYGNTGVLKDTSGAPKLIGGKFKIYPEANGGFHWMTFLVETTHPRGPYTYIDNVTSLRVNGGSYSGGAPIWLDSVYHMFYHYSPSGVSVIPTYLAYATSTDGITFTQKEVAYKKLESFPFGTANPQDLQIADMSLAQIKGKVYHVAEFYRNNVDPAKSVLYRWRFNGSFKELITNLTNCIGCAAIYP